MTIILTILFNIGVLYIFHRYLTQHMNEYLLDQSKYRNIKIYSLCMLILIFLIAIGRSIVYSNSNFFVEIKYIALISIMWPIALIDLKQYKIPNAFIVLGVAYRAVILLLECIFNANFPVYIVISEVIGAIAMLFATMLCRLVIKDSIGYGDIKLFMLIGIFLGVQRLWTAMFFILISIFVVCIYLLVTKKANKKDVVPFGPSIVFGTLIAVILF